MACLAGTEFAGRIEWRGRNIARPAIRILLDHPE
jgi:hypothetical protein